MIRTLQWATLAMSLAATCVRAQDGEALIGTWAGSMPQASVSIETHIWRGTRGSLCAVAIYQGLACHGEMVQVGSVGGAVEFFEATLPRSSQCRSFSYTSFAPLQGGVERVSSPLQGPATSQVRLASAPLSPTLAARLGHRITGDPELAALTLDLRASPGDVRAAFDRLMSAPGEALVLTSFPPKVASALMPAPDATRAAVAQLAQRVPELTEVSDVLRIAEELAWRAQVDVRGFYALARDFESAAAAVRSSARDTAVVDTLRRHALAWDRVRQRAASGCDATAVASQERIVALATSSPALRQLLQASQAHAALEQSLAAAVRAPSTGDSRKQADATTARVLRAMRGAMTTATAAGATRVVAASLAVADLRLSEPDTFKRANAVAQAREEDARAAPGFDTLRKRGPLGARLAPLEDIVRTPPPSYMLSMVRRAMARAEPGDALQRRLASFEALAAAAVDELDKDNAADEALDAMQDDAGRVRLDELAGKMAAGDKAAARQLDAAAGKIAAHKVLRQAAALAAPWRALLGEVRAQGDAAAAMRVELETSPALKGALAALNVEEALVAARERVEQARERARLEREARRADARATQAEFERRDADYESCAQRPAQCVEQNQYASCVRWEYSRCEW